jgi:hypothetical protein
MPHFSQDGDLDVVSYVTGPKHVRLGLKFATSPRTTVLTVRPPIGGCDHGVLDPAKIEDAVLRGVADASAELFVERIEYVANDSPDYVLYNVCARLLAARFLTREANPG